jgi:murein DD-endopeptidase MepM/ murein hydrolase activator NlpD
MLRTQDLIKRIALHRFLRLRQRYVFTKGNKVRLRYVLSSGLVLMSALGFAATQITPVLSSLEIASADSAAAIEPSSGKDSVEWVMASNVQDGISSGMRKAPAAIQKASTSATALHIQQSQNVHLGRGDTLAGVLEEAGVSDDDAYQAVKALSEHVNPRSLRPGQVINIQFKPTEDDMQFSRMTMNLDPLKEITVRKENDKFLTNLKEKELKSRTYAGYAKIDSSLYGSAQKAGIPSQVVADVIKLYSRNIDFQRDLRQGDKIEVLYEGKETPDGEYAKYGDLLYASLTIGGKSVQIYRFEGDDGRVDYYGPDGKTTRKTLLKTPVDGARMSSGFGMRFHPILGYTRMHKGIDFAAPTGTPIYAAGDGTIDFEGRKSGYGNFVSIRHNSQLKTAYAHMSRFASGLHSGDRVKQGQVIGYVGATGDATGPHLHYEVLVNSAQVNPRSVDLPTGENLSGRQLARFKKTISGLGQQFASLTRGLNVAQGDGGVNSHIN